MLDKMLLLRYSPSRLGKKTLPDEITQLPTVDILKPQDRDRIQEEQFGDKITEENKERQT
jgi:hypothetical protein